MRSVVLALSVGLLAGCDAVLGIEDLPRALAAADASSGEDAPAPLNQPCVQCGTSECGSERAACTADPACSRLLDRLDRCHPNDVMCRARAENESGGVAAAEPFIALDRCRRAKCIDTCYGVGGLLAAIDDRCGCADQACEAAVRTCIQSGGTQRAGMCERRIACIASRTNPDGFVECIGETTGGGDSYPLLDCARANRCGECPLATGKLECVGKFAYGRTRVDSLPYRLGVRDPLASKPVVGAKVVACGPPSCSTCVPVTSEVLTEADGRVSLLELPMTAGGFEGCFRFEPPESSGGDLFPLMVFTGRKIHNSEDLLTTLMLGETVLNVYAGLVDKTPDPTRGHVIGTIHDCLWGRVANAQVAPVGPMDGATLAYIDSRSLAVGSATTTSGEFAFLNVPPGRHTISITKEGKEIARATFDVLAGHFSDLNIYPNPEAAQ